MTLSDISRWQPRAWRIIARSFVADRMASTYLLHGPRGSGRWSMALAIAALVNCEGPRKDNSDMVVPCGKCRSCRNIADLNFEGLLFALPLSPFKNLTGRVELTNELLANKRENPFYTIQGESSLTIPIEVAREIKKDLSRRVGGEFRRVAIFYEMELMRQASADALLKMIEEPPPDSLIIMTSSHPEKLLPTIHSRAQRVKLNRVSTEAIREYLKQTYEVTEKKAELCAQLAEGSIGQGVDLIEASHDDDGSSRAVGFMLFKSLFNDSNVETVSLVNEMIPTRNRSEAEQLLTLWQSLIRDCGVYAVSGNEADMANVDLVPELIKLAPRFSRSNRALDMASQIKITLADLDRNVHIPGALAGLALKLKANLNLQN